MSHLNADAREAARQFGRTYPPLTSDQKALIADVFAPLLKQWAAEDAKPKTRKRAA